MTATTITVTSAELRARLDELLAAARTGTEVLIRDADQPGVRLAPTPAEPPRREWKFNLHPGAMVMREDFDDPIDEDAFLRGDL